MQLRMLTVLSVEYSIARVDERADVEIVKGRERVVAC